MKFGAHQTFHLREGWLLKGLNSVKEHPNVFSSSNAVVELGVGKNMVESIEYWLKALQLITKKDSGYELTSIAQLISSNDPYLEQDGSLILCHYLLSTNKNEATTWYWFFNKFGATEFEVDSMKIYLQSYVHGQFEKVVNPNTLDKDISCLLRTYREPSYGDKETPETENPSPFAKFGFIGESNSKLKKNKLNISEVHPLVFIFLTYLFWKDELSSPKSIQIEEIVFKESSPCLSLGFSMDDCLLMIEQIEKDFPKYIQFSRTGGYMILNIDEKTSKTAMRDYYKLVSVGN